MNIIISIQHIIDYLKFDIEYDEWESLQQIMLDTDIMSNVKQIAVETHTKEVILKTTTDVDYINYINILTKLQSKGFRLWSTHVNQFGKRPTLTGVIKSCCHELVFVNIKFTADSSPL